MKSTALILCLATAVAAHAQTAAKHTTPAAKHTATAHTPAAAAADVKYPDGIKPIPGVKKVLLSLRYQDIKIGTGPDAEPMKMYKVKYTGWRASDGVIFDAWDKHPSPVLDKDGKPVMGDDGKPKMADPQPASFPVGLGRVIPGFDQGFGGMKVGGIRRIFIPWQLGYGMHAMADRDKDHPGIPAKSDLVFDVELVDMADLPAAQPPHPGMPGGAGAAGAPTAAPHPATPPPSGAPANSGATTPPSGSTQTPPPQK